MRCTTSNEDSTVVYQAAFFAQYNPLTANDMLERIPGLNLDAGGSGNDGDRGLGTRGNLLIDGERVAGKNNATQDLLDRLPANDVQRIEIIRCLLQEPELDKWTYLLKKSKTTCRSRAASSPRPCTTLASAHSVLHAWQTPCLPVGYM